MAVGRTVAAALPVLAVVPALFIVARKTSTWFHGFAP
jgi:hypothetical protein